MKPDRGEAMHDARRLDSLRKQTLVLAATEAALQRGCQPAIAEIARDAGVGRKFIYDHPELRAAIELKLAQAAEHRADRMITAARVTGASLRADLENSRAENGRLRKRLQTLESRLSRAEGARIVADNLVPGDVLAELADEQLARHVAESRAATLRGTGKLSRRRRGTRGRPEHQPRTHAACQSLRPGSSASLTTRPGDTCPSECSTQQRQRRLIRVGYSRIPRQTRRSHRQAPTSGTGFQGSPLARPLAGLLKKVDADILLFLHAKSFLARGFWFRTPEFCPARTLRREGLRRAFS